MKEQERKANAFKTADRANTELYNTAEWRQLRQETLFKHPFCEVCGSEENLQVHHKQAPRGNKELFFNPDNLMVVCADCHRKITANEIRERKK
jgi:5-methylcytosine-specific restriction endonuclease McrA